MFNLEEIYSVSDYIKLCKNTIEKNIPQCFVQGEISNLSKPSSGHWYFTLKDKNGQVRCAFFRLNQRKIKFKLKSIYKYHLSETEISNCCEEITKVINKFNKNRNKEYSLDVINKILEEIDMIASNRLYDFIDAKVEEEIVDGNKLNLNFIVSDSKKYYVERINILGNYSTIEEVIRNKLIVDEGDPLNNLLFNKSINEIKSLNIFKTVNSQIKDGSNDNLKILDITVEEQPTGEIALSAGFGTNGVATGGGINERNFLGKGINLNTNLEITEETLKAVSYTHLTLPTKA